MMRLSLLLLSTSISQRTATMMNRNAKNILDDSSRRMFDAGFTERTDLEQYFWTEETVNKLVESLRYTEDCCCLTTPSLGHGFYKVDRDEVVLDIDTRFDYLPKFRYFDILSPSSQEEDFSIIIMDPPFFYIPMQEILEAVMVITKGRTNVKLMIGFLKREERELLQVFSDFQLKPTSFQLEYATVKPNKWKNYVLYSNVDLPGIKRRV